MTLPGLLLGLVYFAIVAFALYCVVRLAVTHALRDARNERRREEAWMARMAREVEEE